MNERIRDLKEQSLVWAIETLDPDVLNDNEWAVAIDEKFAELIVRECLKEIKDMIVDESELLYPNNNQTTECVNDRLMDAYDNITELFGVEE